MASERDKLVLDIKVRILGEQVSFMKGPYGEAVFLPFEGEAESEVFKGRILPAGVDVQTVNPAGIRHMCAKYMLKGTDHEGNECHIFVENNGYFEPGNNPSPFHAYPVLMSDSPVLADYFARAVFRAEGHPLEGGVNIRIYEVLK